MSYRIQANASRPLLAAAQTNLCYRSHAFVIAADGVVMYIHSAEEPSRPSTCYRPASEVTHITNQFFCAQETFVTGALRLVT